MKKGSSRFLKNMVMIYVDINTESYLIRLKNKSVRKDCTIPAWMDDEVKKYGISCSKVLQNALAMKIAGEREKDNIVQRCDVKR